MNNYKPNGSKFDPNTLKPFDKVLILTEAWVPVLFTYLDRSFECPRMINFGDPIGHLVIPYNEETKHLIGTRFKAPEYYRYWKD